MRKPCLLSVLLGPLLFGAPPLAGQQIAALETELRSRIARDTALVAVAYYDPVTRDTLLIEGLTRFHAASTMKVPVLIELGRRIESGELRWSDTLPVRNRFHSIVDGSEFHLDPADDSDATLYAREGRGVAIAELARLMIARSSNLAANLLIERLDPIRVNGTAHTLGADSIAVLRGVEDGKAYALGRNNTTTARDLARLLDAIARGRAAGPATTAVLLELLLAQEFNAGIPAGLPPGVRVAHKTGEITGITHDAAIVYPAARGPYVLVVLTRGFTDRREAERLMAELSGIVYRWATRRPDPRE
ncbi:MAG: serine hydrolase [Gemmatimonadetes bacterium]|nr:serine hydrolase [Gemmatimonadota bacterium]